MEALGLCWQPWALAAGLVVGGLTPRGDQIAFDPTMSPPSAGNPKWVRMADLPMAMLDTADSPNAWAPAHRLPMGAPGSLQPVELAGVSNLAQDQSGGVEDAPLTGPTAQAILPGNLVITEIMYHPPEGSDLEFVELANVGTAPLNLAGAQFVDGISYTFGEVWLEPGELIVVAANPAALAARHADRNFRIAPGAFSGRLDNAGERLTLVDALGLEVFNFAYSDGGGWPGRADGHGSSLERADLEIDPGRPEAWEASTLIGGSPGLRHSPTPPPVVINEVLAHTDPPFEDAIELFNPSEQPIDLSGWFLTDTPDEPARFEIPPGTVIGPRGFRVFYEIQFNTNNLRTPFSLSSVYGDETLLVKPDAAGNPEQFVDHVTFGPSLNGVPFGRWPDGGTVWTRLQHQTLGTTLQRTDPGSLLELFRMGQGAPNAPPLVGPVVITAIMYHPPPEWDEFLELRNLSSDPVPLFDPLNPENTWQFVNGIQFAFPPDVTLAPGERILVCGVDPALLRRPPGWPADTRVFGPWTGSLDNAGELIELAQPDAPETRPPNIGYVPYPVVEDVRYDNQSPWPESADGQGAWLVRVDPTAYGSDPANWRASDADAGQDTDGDGMPDAWERIHGLDPAWAGDAGLDADGDGWVNLQEYLAGTDPNDPASRLRIDSLEVTLEGQVRLRFHASADRAYVVEASPSVTAPDWQTVTAIPAGEARMAEVTEPANGSGHRFYRLRLTSPTLP